MKTYEVILTGYRVILVEAIDEEEAHHIAVGNTSNGDFEVDNGSIRDISFSPTLERRKQTTDFIPYEQ